MISLLKRRALHPVTKEEIFYPAWAKNQDTDSVELAELMAQAGSMSAGMVSASLLDFPKFIIAELLKGNQVNIRGLGSFKLKVKGKSKKKIEEVTATGLRDTLEMVFEPEEKLTALLRADAKFRFVVKRSGAEDDVVVDASAGTDYEPEEPIDSSTGTIDVSTNTADASTNTVDSSAGTIDPSTNGGGNDGMD